MNRRVTSTRVMLAVAVAVGADLLQLPLALAGLAATLSGIGIVGDAPIEAVDIAIDAVTAGIMYLLLGFHWLLLPTAAIELIPGIDAAPTWTACVLIVVWRERRGRGGNVEDLIDPRVKRIPGTDGGSMHTLPVKSERLAHSKSSRDAAGRALPMPSTTCSPTTSNGSDRSSAGRMDFRVELSEPAQRDNHQRPSSVRPLETRVASDPGLLEYAPV